MSTNPYPHGFESILAAWQSRRTPLVGAEAALPPLDVDLGPLMADRVAGETPGGKGFHAKKKALSKEFIGHSSLCLLNACLIATLRKSAWPDHAPALFCRLWTEASDHLLDQLDLRWKVSSITTFADHGATVSQRRLGLGLSIVFGMLKLTESERLFSGLDPSTPFRRGQRAEAALPLEMEAYSLRNGGLDVNLLAPLWQDANSDPVAGPLAKNLLTALIGSDATVFARLTEMRRRLEKRGPR